MYTDKIGFILVRAQKPKEARFKFIAGKAVFLPYTKPMQLTKKDLIFKDSYRAITYPWLAIKPQYIYTEKKMFGELSL